VGKIAENTVCRNVHLTIWHCILSVELTNTHSFRLFFAHGEGRFLIKKLVYAQEKFTIIVFIVFFYLFFSIRHGSDLK